VVNFSTVRHRLIYLPGQTQELLTWVIVAYDDGRGETKTMDLITDGILVNYQGHPWFQIQYDLVKMNLTVAVIFTKLAWRAVSTGCLTYSWYPYVRKKNISREIVIKMVEKVSTLRSWLLFYSLQQRDNFQSWWTIYLRNLKTVKLSIQIEELLISPNTQDFWNNCTQLARNLDYRLGGFQFFDGKGQPSHRLVRVSPGCPNHAIWKH